MVGGYAVIHYGYHRTTDDIDLWIGVDPKNAEKVSRVLQKWGGFAADEVPPSKFLQERALIIFGVEPGRVDLLTFTTGLKFDEFYARRNVVKMDGIRVPLISLEDKINKRATGRHKDLADLDYLEVVTHAQKRSSRAKVVRKRKPKRGLE